MKKYLPFIFLLGLITSYGYAQESYTINASGFQFDPADLVINAGDTIHFNSGSSHPVLQVSQATWDANGTTPLEGGFSFPGGIGAIVLEEQGTYYYVCTNHVSLGMKGTIEVNALSDINSETTGSHLYTVYPNPVTGDYFHIAFDEKVPSELTLKLYDVVGKEVYSQTLLPESSKVLNIPVSGMQQGIYLLELKGNGYSAISRLMIR